MQKNYAHEDIKTKYDPAKALQPYYAAFFVVAVIIGLKTYAYASSGAASLLASLIDSVGDFAISFMSYLSVRLSLKPADEEHRFGHGKAEGFSALFQACFLFGAATFLLFETAQRVFNPVDISHHELGIVISIIAMALTFALIFVQNSAYKSAPSLALKADQKHYTSDVLLNASVIIALATDLWLGLYGIDIAIGAFIAAFIIWSGFQIAKEAVDMLMDKEIEETERQKILDIVLSRDDVYGIHDLRTRKSGMQLYISFYISALILSLIPSFHLKRRMRSPER